MSLKGTNQEFGRPYNRRIVLETIRQHGPIERAGIAQKVGLTVQTVANIIRELEELGLVSGERTHRKSRGSPPMSLTLNPQGAYAIGVNVTPRGIEAALVDLAGSIVEVQRLAMSPPHPDDSFREIGRLVETFRAATSGRMLLGIGLAMPGPFDVDKMSFVGPTTLESWRGVAVAERLSEATGLAAFVETDMAAAALGESLHGAGRNVSAFYYLYFGVGLGGSMVKDGVPLRGFYGNAGEIGHVPMVPNGRPCSCGNKGCLERYVSLEAFQRRAPIIGQPAWIEEAAPLLRNAIVTIENLFDPETVVIGGIMDDELLGELVAALDPLPTSVADRKGRTAPRIMRSASGQDAVLRGAASLAFSGVLSPRFGQDGGEKDPLFARSRVA
ncbi:ROK family transcriptional regulator [Aestuariivirga litoralis]|uniref:ROK family transcriptional regulator n=1 Tax=Aestuariivirga litoralis TaxID=2650924 RepID=A0A2W2BMX3_9HYPH|nr:ROK family transcriptional regulator [Aestuariivirga litoralis]PZF77207.1 ROK family transcriptional regulator [Aestuariivirga litoralis]